MKRRVPKAIPKKEWGKRLKRLVNKYGRVMVTLRHPYESWPSRQRVIYKDGRIKVRYHKYDHIDDDPKLYGRYYCYEKCCFVGYRDRGFGLNNTVDLMTSHDSNVPLMPISIHVGRNLKKKLRIR